MKKNIIISSLFILFALQLVAQVNDSIPDYFNPEKAKQFTTEDEKPELGIKKKINYGVEVGTSVGTFGKGSMVSTFAAPHLAYDLSPKLQLRAGTIFSTGIMNNAGLQKNSGEAYTSISGNINRNFIYAQGLYKLNKNITISGMAFTETLMFKSDKNDYQINSKGFIIGGQYDFDNGFSIGVDLGMSNKPYNPYGGLSHYGTGFNRAFNPGF